MRVVAGCLTLALALGAAGLARAQETGAQQGLTVLEGQQCSLCHAVARKGNKTAAQEAGSTATPPMKASPGRPAAALDALVAYVHSLK